MPPAGGILSVCAFSLRHVPCVRVDLRRCRTAGSSKNIFGRLQHRTLDLSGSLWHVTDWLPQGPAAVPSGPLALASRSLELALEAQLLGFAGRELDLCQSLPLQVSCDCTELRSCDPGNLSSQRLIEMKTLSFVSAWTAADVCLREQRKQLSTYLET